MPRPRFACLLFLSLSLLSFSSCSGPHHASSSPPAPANLALQRQSDAPPAETGPLAVAVSPVFPAPEPWAPAPSPKNNVASPSTNALTAVVVDEASGAVLYDKDAHLAVPPASLTKIATAILALEHGDLDAWVDIDVDSRTMRGSTVMGLEFGDRFRLRDLLYGLMLPSGNDAAVAIARFVSGSDAAFVAGMNALLARLGLHDSHFENPHGLGGRNHLASAYDLAMLARFAMTLPGFHEIINTAYYTARGSRTLSFANVNTFLGAYPGADGVKTGYTRGAGRTLVASAFRNGHRVYAVVLNSGSRDDDAIRLMSWAFANFVWP